MARTDVTMTRSRSKGQRTSALGAAGDGAQNRDLKAEEDVFGTSLTRGLILFKKLDLEKYTRTDEDIRGAVREWLEDPVAAERRYGHTTSATGTCRA